MKWWPFNNSPALSGVFFGALVTFVAWVIAYAFLHYRSLTPHYEHVCTSYRQELTILPMTIPNGNNGFTTFMQPTYVDVCETGYYICSQYGAQVESALCLEKDK